MKVLLQYQTFNKELGQFFQPSSHTDILLFLLGLKPAVRTKILQPNQAISNLEKWIRQWKFFIKIDNEGYIYLSNNDALTDQLFYVDNHEKGHEESLGALLGYPSCCCKKIMTVGECNIDHYEKELTKNKFYGKFQLINPSSYRKGVAFISHVPCSTTCFQSLEIAIKFAKFLWSKKLNPLFKPWRRELDNIMSKNLELEINHVIF